MGMQVLNKNQAFFSACNQLQVWKNLKWASEFIYFWQLIIGFISIHNFSLVKCKCVKILLLLYLNVMYIFVVYYYDFLKIPQQVYLRWRKEFVSLERIRIFENRKDFNTFLNGIQGMGIRGTEFFQDSYKSLFFFALLNVSH